MATFQYIALNQQGKRCKGVGEADTARTLRQQLREKGLMPIEVTVATEKSAATTSKKRLLSWGRQKRLSSKELMLITRQLATLLSASMPIDEALAAVAHQNEKDTVKSVLLGVREQVLEGRSLAAGMEMFPSAFPKLYRTTVAAGEQSGQLDQVLIRLSEYTEKQQRIRQKIQHALVYPIMMTLVSMAIVVFLLVYVVPKIIDVFIQSGQTLPFATAVLISMSHFIGSYGLYLCVLLGAGAFVFFRALKKPATRHRFDTFLLKIPMLGRAVRTLNTARFSRTLGILTAASVPLLEAMQAAAQLIVPMPMQEAVMEAVDKVREGGHIHIALKQTQYFDPMLIHLIASGEASGQLEQMLIKAADNEDADVEALIATTLTLFEPIMILVMGGIVLFIVLAIMLPIFSLNQLAG